MFPPVHLAVGYLAYAAYARLVRGALPPRGWAVPVAAFAAVLPDLVDQPLSWWAGMATTRTVAHSLLTAVPLVTVAYLLARGTGRRDLGVAFAVGYLSHPAADAVWPIVVGATAELGYLLWPITPMPDYRGQKHLATVGGVDVTTVPFEIGVFVLGTALWWRDRRAAGGSSTGSGR